MRNKHRRSNLSVFEAIETLSMFADLPLETGQNKESLELTFEGKKIPSKYIIPEKPTGRTLETIKEIFSVLLNYLRDFYKNDSKANLEPQAVERIKTIMGLVGNAAQKIDLYTSLFYTSETPSVTRSREYRLLQDFYKKKVERKAVNAKVMNKWMDALAERSKEKKILEGKVREIKAPIYKFIDLEALKKDVDYELLYIRKEDGSLFFSPRLIKNMKLVCDFSTAPQKKDPLVDLNFWKDEALQKASESILKKHEGLINRFYKEAFRFRHREIVVGAHNCLMALMLCSNKENNFSTDQDKKGSYDYFSDFLYFLRELTLSSDYLHITSQERQSSSGANACSFDLINAFCRSLYIDLKIFNGLGGNIGQIISEATHEIGLHATERKIGSRLALDYAALQRALKFHPSGPLKKMLNSFESGRYKSFDPLHQGNLPSQLYNIYSGDKRISNIHLPSPTHQEYINKVHVLDEFKSFLRSYGANNSNDVHLIVNLQDRTSWKEHSRSVAIEELASNALGNSALVVVTLAKETAFANQLSPYDVDNHFEAFEAHFKEHFGDESSGYFFPPAIGASLNSAFVDQAFDGIHKMFFSGKNVLTREERLNFIEIFDLLLILKLLDLSRPTSFSFSCKDGVDLGASSSALLYLFLKLMNENAFNDEDWKLINSVLYGPSLMMRERAMLHERFQRVLGAFNSVEFVYRELGHKNFAKQVRETFGPLYKGSILEATVDLRPIA